MNAWLDMGAMTSNSTSSAEAALARLSTALARLESAVSRRLEDERHEDREAELALMAEDRARLAAALDAASARLAQVEATTGEVGVRIDRAIGAVERVLGRPQDAG